MTNLKQMLRLALLIYLVSCEKSTVTEKVAPIPAEVSCAEVMKEEGYTSTSHILDKSDEDKYFEIWKTHLIEKSDITSNQFDEHFSDFRVSSSSYNDGKSVRVEYTFNDDWIVFKTYDKFLVEFYPSDVYPQHSFPRGELLDETWTVYLIENNIGPSINFTPVDLSEKSVFRTCTEALDVAREKSGYETLEMSSIDFFVAGRIPRENGQPHARLGGVIDQDENLCLDGHINLITGELDVHETVCVIIN